MSLTAFTRGPVAAADPVLRSSISPGVTGLLTLPPHNEGTAVFVLHVNLVVFSLIGLLSVPRLVRTLVRLSRWHAWKDGFLLRHKRLKVSPRSKSYKLKGYKPGTLPISWPRNTLPNDMASDDSHINLVDMSRMQSIPKTLPRHIGPASTFPSLQPLSSVLRTRLFYSQEMTVGRLAIVAIYLGIMLFASLFKNNLFTNSKRAGYVAMSQVPLVFALATKNNIIGMFAAVGYEKLNFFHRFVGRILVLLVNFHSFGYFYRWQLEGTFTSSMRQPSHIWGVLGFAAINFVYLSSFGFMRKRFHTLFFVFHFVGFSLFLVAIYKHQPIMIPYVFAACGLYGLDRVILRSIKTRFTKATIRALPELNATHIQIPGINAGWRAGQHVRVQVLSKSMGWVGCFEVHPFTVASVSESEEGMVLICQDVGDWTRKLYNLASAGIAAAEKGGEVGREVRLMVEGPYGGLGCTVVSSYSAALLIAGGSGITFALSAAQHLLNCEVKGQNQVEVLHVVWIIKDPASVCPLIPTLTSLIRQAQCSPMSNLTVNVSIYYTGTSRASPKTLAMLDTIHLGGLEMRPNRPDIASVITETIDQTVKPNRGLASGKDETRYQGDRKSVV